MAPAIGIRRAESTPERMAMFATSEAGSIPYTFVSQLSATLPLSSKQLAASDAKKINDVDRKMLDMTRAPRPIPSWKKELSVKQEIAGAFQE
jgi:hypothetical protein